MPRRPSTAALRSAAACSGRALRAPSASSPRDRWRVEPTFDPRRCGVGAAPSEEQPRLIHRSRLLQTAETIGRDIEVGKDGARHPIPRARPPFPRAKTESASDEQQAGIEERRFQRQSYPLDRSVGDIAVASLTTNDAQFGCRNWTGSYQLSKDGARWLFDRASIGLPSARLGSFTVRDELDKLRWDGDNQFKTDRKSRVLKPRDRRGVLHHPCVHPEFSEWERIHRSMLGR